VNLSMTFDFDGYTAAFSSRDVDSILSFHAEDSVFQDGAAQISIQGAEKLREFLAASFKLIPDFSMTVLQLFEGINACAFEWVMRGTRSGTPFEIQGVTILEIVDNKIRRHADYYSWESWEAKS
jgi:steroid delta-isomerase-like uncharacterized protein